MAERSSRRAQSYNYESNRREQSYSYGNDRRTQSYSYGNSRREQGNRYGDSERVQPYNYGSAAVELEPERKRPEPRRRPKESEHRQPKKVNQDVNRNIQRQEEVDFRYMVVLTVVVVALAIAFVSYLRLESAIIRRSSNITSLQREISDLTMENDAALDAIEDSVDLNTVKDKAESLGMVYITGSQVIAYESPIADYVIQYEEIPSSGVLAQSESVIE